MKMVQLRQGRIPKRLEKEPLVEAAWELRFEPKDGITAELIAGAIYQKLRSEYPRIVRLPAADMPHPIVEADPQLRYAAQVRLHGAGELSNTMIQVGERVVTLNNRRPYLGWERLASQINRLAEVIEETELVERAERFSLRYIDLLELEPPPSLTSLRIHLELAGCDLSHSPVLIKTEVAQGQFRHLIQIASPAETALSETEKRVGTIIDTETVRRIDSGEDLRQLLERNLQEAHDQSHRLFFSILTDEALERLGPVYQ